MQIIYHGDRQRILIKFISKFILLKKYRRMFKDKMLANVYDLTTIMPNKVRKGRVLVCCMPYPRNEEELKRHAVVWTSYRICEIFREKGYIVDVISNGDSRFVPSKKYDIIFDAYWNLERLAKYAPKHTKKVVLFSEGYQPYANQAELSRIEDLKKRKSIDNYSAKRTRPIDCMDKSFAVADYVALIGNQHTLATYPKDWQDKITLVTTNTLEPSLIKNREDILSSGDEFLWHFGQGAVHKGLDLVLDVFKQNPSWKLNIVANLEEEPDFLKIYHHELFETPNIKYHGFMDTSGEAFKAILQNCIAFIAPSCSEGISPACAILLKAGLYPIISENCGIDLPDNCGVELKLCSHQEIEEGIKLVLNKSKNELSEEVLNCQALAKKQYSQAKFSEDMEAFIDRIIS